MSHSRSFPLLHSAAYIQDFKKFTFTEDQDADQEQDRDHVDDHEHEHVHDFEEEGIMNIPSPPPVSTTPDINSSLLLPKLKNVHTVKSWESVNSSNIGSVHSFPDDNSENGMQAFADGHGKLLTSGQGQQNHSLTELISDDHFIKEKLESSIAQKQWLRKNVTAMKSNAKSRKSQYGSNGRNNSSLLNTGLVHIHHGSKVECICECI